MISHQIKQITKGIVGAVVFGFTTSPARAESMGKVSGYYDTRGKNTATITALAPELPLGTTFYGFTNLETENWKSTAFHPPYTQLRIAKQSELGLGVAAEYDRDFSMPNGVTRLGGVFEPNLSSLDSDLFLGLKVYPLSAHDQGVQMGIYGQKGWKKNLVTLDGFIEYNSKSGKAVSELQLGVRMNEGLYAVLEGRYNGFLPQDQVGIGIGLEWRF